MLNSRLITVKPVLVLLVLSILSIMTMGSALVQPFPEVISLPDGFRPEGIAVGNSSTFYVGSLANGAIYRGDLRTGEGSLLFKGSQVVLQPDSSMTVEPACSSFQAAQPEWRSSMMGKPVNL